MAPLEKRGVDGEGSDAWRQRQFRGISDEEKEVMLRNYAGEGAVSGKIFGQSLSVRGQSWLVLGVMVIALFAAFAGAIVYYVRDGNIAQAKAAEIHASNLAEVRRQIRREKAQDRYEHAMVAYRMNRNECQNSFEFKDRSMIRADRRRGIDRLQEECPWIGQEPKPPQFVENNNGH